MKTLINFNRQRLTNLTYIFSIIMAYAKAGASKAKTTNARPTILAKEWLTFLLKHPRGRLPANWIAVTKIYKQSK